MRRKFDFLLTATAIIKPEYFEDKVLSWAFTVMVSHYQDYAVCAERRVLENELDKAVAAGRLKNDEAVTALALIKDIDETNVSDGDPYTVGEVVRFCRRQEVRRALLEVAPQTESEDAEVWDKIEDKISKACNVGAHSISLGTSYFAEYQQRCRERLLDEGQRVIPTGISELDVLLGGGLKAGQLGVWMGGTGMGKSIALPHCGKFAVVKKLKVLHYTLELNEIEVATRYDAAWSGVPVYDLKQNSTKVEDKLSQLLSRYGEALIIKEYPTNTATLDTLKHHLMSLRSTAGFIPDLIVLDYGDLLKPTSSYQDAYEDLGTIFKDLRGLAGELNIPIWTATQSNRTGNNQEVVDLDSVGDSFKKVQIADVVIAIGGTPEDKGENIVRLNIAKNRNGPDKRVIAIRTAYDRMCFYDPVAEPPGPRKRTPVLTNGEDKAPGLPSRRAPRSVA